MDSAQMVAHGTILRATVGSTLHGLHHGGQDDRDEMAVYVEPSEYLVGLARARGIKNGLYGFEHYVERTQPEGVRSGPGDLDLVAYSLRKYVRLALKGALDDPAPAVRPGRARPRADGTRGGAAGPATGAALEACG